MKLPIGIDSFQEIRQGDYQYVDKTKLIAKFLSAGEKVTLITRPRRFGKTLGLDTIKTFLDCGEDTKELFAGLEIMDTQYAGQIHSAPVLFFTFKDCKGNQDFIIDSIKYAIYSEYRRYSWIQNEIVHEDDKQQWFEMKSALLGNSTAKFTKISRSISFLCEMIGKYTGKISYLLIDEYDTPMISAYESQCYKELRSFFSVLYGSALKGNRYIQKALLTGINRIAKENLFSGLNNLLVETVMDQNYADCFGFTETEARHLLESGGMELTEEVKQYYDGYCFGNQTIYNPWSLLCYMNTGNLQGYWVNTSSNAIIKWNLKHANQAFKEKFEKLIQTGAWVVPLNLNTSIFEAQDESVLWGLFVNSGYLTVVKQSSGIGYIVKIPNLEVVEEFQSIVTEYIGLSEGYLDLLFDCLLNRKDIKGFARMYADILIKLVSSYDLLENSYHMLLLGMCIYLQGRYEIQSNREAGRGRYDIMLKSKKETDIHVLIELKHEKTKPVEKQAEEAVQQIWEKQYYQGLTGNALFLGLGHVQKECAVKYECVKIGADGTIERTEQTEPIRIDAANPYDPAQDVLKELGDDFNPVWDNPTL